MRLSTPSQYWWTHDSHSICHNESERRRQSRGHHWGTITVAGVTIVDHTLTVAGDTAISISGVANVLGALNSCTVVGSTILSGNVDLGDESADAIVIAGDAMLGTASP